MPELTLGRLGEGCRTKLEFSPNFYGSFCQTAGYSQYDFNKTKLCQEIKVK